MTENNEAYCLKNRKDYTSSLDFLCIRKEN